MADDQYRVMADEAETRLLYEESYMLVIGFPTAADNLSVGQMVKMNADGTVAAVTAATDQPFGFVVSNWKKTDKGNVRVYVPCACVVTNVIADGALEEGQYVAATGVDANNVPKYKAAVAGNFISGICLIGGTDGTKVRIGILRVPQKIASGT